MKFHTYTALGHEARKRGVSLGRLINDILDKYVEELTKSGMMPAVPICIICGEPAVFRGRGKGKQVVYVCKFHRDFIKQLNSYKDMRG